MSPTLLLAVDHHKAELAGEAADGSGGQCQQGAKALSMKLVETHHWVRGTG